MTCTDLIENKLNGVENDGFMVKSKEWKYWNIFICKPDLQYQFSLPKLVNLIERTNLYPFLISYKFVGLFLCMSVSLSHYHIHSLLFPTSLSILLNFSILSFPSLSLSLSSPHLIERLRRFYCRERSDLL